MRKFCTIFIAVQRNWEWQPYTMLTLADYPTPGEGGMYPPFALEWAQRMFPQLQRSNLSQRETHRSSGKRLLEGGIISPTRIYEWDYGVWKRHLYLLFVDPWPDLQSTSPITLRGFEIMSVYAIDMTVVKYHRNRQWRSFLEQRAQLVPIDRHTFGERLTLENWRCAKWQ